MWAVPSPFLGFAGGETWGTERLGIPNSVHTSRQHPLIPHQASSLSLFGAIPRGRGQPRGLSQALPFNLEIEAGEK